MQFHCVILNIAAHLSTNYIEKTLGNIGKTPAGYDVQKNMTYSKELLIGTPSYLQL